jgi:hypothetical protein
LTKASLVAMEDLWRGLVVATSHLGLGARANCGAGWTLLTQEAVQRSSMKEDVRRESSRGSPSSNVASGECNVLLEML